MCNRDGDNLITGDELAGCAQDIAELINMSRESSQALLYNFGVKYWDTVDINDDNALEFDEFKYGMAAFAATDAGLIITAFDSNDDNIIEERELHYFFEFVEEIFEHTGHNFYDLEEIWYNANG